jgi:hypothetical protein
MFYRRKVGMYAVLQRSTGAQRRRLAGLRAKRDAAFTTTSANPRYVGFAVTCRPQSTLVKAKAKPAEPLGDRFQKIFFGRI